MSLVSNWQYDVTSRSICLYGLETLHIHINIWLCFRARFVRISSQQLTDGQFSFASFSCCIVHIHMRSDWTQRCPFPSFSASPSNIC